ncbi:MAG: ATP-binding protein [Bacteroidota bacterium]
MSEDINSSKSRIILALTSAMTNPDRHLARGAIEKFVSSLPEVVVGDRILFFLTDPSEDTFSVHWEWHHPDVFPVKDQLQGLHFRDYMIWGKFSLEKPFFQISDTRNIPDSYPFDSKLFRDTQCGSFIQKALITDDQKIGFLALLKREPGFSWQPEDIDFLGVCSEVAKCLLLSVRSSEASGKGKAETETPIPLKLQDQSLFSDSGDLLDKVFGNLHYGVAMFDCNQQKFVYSNMCFAGLFNVSDPQRFLPDEIFEIFRNNGYNTSDFFAPDQKELVKDFALSYNGKYLNGTINPVKGSHWVVMTVNDITPIANYEKAEKHFNNQLQILNEAAVSMIVSASDTDSMLKYIGETAFQLAGDAIVLVHKYHPEEGYLKTIFVKGIGFSIDVLAKLLGKHPLGKKYPLEKEGGHYNEIINTKAKEIRGGVESLSLGTIASPVATKIEKTLNIHKAFSCGLSTENILFGTITFLLRPGHEMNISILDTFARMASNALHAIRVGHKLKKTSQVLTEAASIAKVGYWEYDFARKQFCISRRLYHKIEKNPFKTQSAEFQDQVMLPIDVFLKKYVSREDASKIEMALGNAFHNQKKRNYTFDLEFKIHTHDNESIDVFTRGVVQGDGRITGVAQDITGIRKVEANLEQSEQKFRNLVEQSLDAIVVVQDDGIITEWNPSAKEISGMEAEDVIGRYAWDVESAMIFSPVIQKEGSLEQYQQKLKKRFFRFFQESNSETPNTSEITIMNHHGEVKYLSVTSFVFSADQRRYLCRISKDVTLEKQKQEKEKQEEISKKAARAKDLFLDNMSHEMRTPLSGIIGMTDILMHTRMTPQQEEMLKVVKESSDSLLELISNIHELSRIEAKGVIVQKKPFRVSMLMEKTVSIFKASALQKSIALSSKNTTPEDVLVMGDEFRLRQVLSNLVANAIKFTPAGGRVEVNASSTLANTNSMDLCIEVTDTGIGIEKEKIPLLFDKFTQVDSSYTREYEGVGIGLSISRELMKLMGGVIGVESEHRKGSTFSIKMNIPYLKE